MIYQTKSETTSHFDTPEIDRKPAQDMSDDISESGKNSKDYSEPFEAYWDTIFDYSTSEIDRQRSNDISDDISDPVKKFKKIIPSRLKHIEILFSIIALPKSIDNIRMTYPMIYQTQ